jgi:hypothetical protein
MRIKILIGVFVLLTLPALAGVPKPGAFAIYLVAAPVDPRVLVRDLERWRQVELAPEPIISDADIISYDFSKHAMRLKPEALKRIPRPGVEGISFVVVAGGERIYLGAFYNGFSSIPYRAPVIVVVARLEQEDLGEDVLFIDRAYPESYGSSNDMRADERIRKALTDLKKLAEL